MNNPIKEINYANNNCSIYNQEIIILQSPHER